MSLREVAPMLCSFNDHLFHLLRAPNASKCPQELHVALQYLIETHVCKMQPKHHKTSGGFLQMVNWSKSFGWVGEGFYLRESRDLRLSGGGRNGDDKEETVRVVPWNKRRVGENGGRGTGRNRDDGGCGRNCGGEGREGTAAAKVVKKRRFNKNDNVKIQIEIITGFDEIASILTAFYRESNAIVVSEKIPWYVSINFR
ncbi:hypothetical protein YC2023_059766 [Brassica napus]